MSLIRFLKIFMLSAIFIAWVYIFYAFFVTRTFFHEGGLVGCGETVLTESSAPDGKYTASVFSGSCGATTPFFTSVNLRSSSDSYLPDQNGMFTTGRIFCAEGQPEIRISWQNDSVLIIGYSDPVHLMKKTEWRNVTILYRLLSDHSSG